MAEVAAFGDELKASEIELDELRGQIEAIALGIPNLPDASVPVGGDESRQCRAEDAGARPGPSISR
jgi:seryl-tRNA synthetase